MQHSDSRPSFAGLARVDAPANDNNALWFALAVAVVGLALALTYALAQSIVTSWLFMD